MNYLAHALLSQDDEAALIGNLAGDHVKGPLHRAQVHSQVAPGVRRHRAVDALSDRHPQSLAARELFATGQRRYAGIFLDVWFDHLLTRHWSRYSRLSLEDFEARVYRAMTARTVLLPPDFARVAPAWAEARWLRAYRSVDGVTAVLERLARRRPRFAVLPQLVEQALRHEAALNGAFRALFDDLLRAHADDLAAHVIPPPPATARDTAQANATRGHPS